VLAVPSCNVVGSDHVQKLGRMAHRQCHWAGIMGEITIAIHGTLLFSR